MTDFKVGEFIMTDRSGKAIHQLIGMNGKPLKGVWKNDRVRLAPDPRIKELEATLERIQNIGYLVHPSWNASKKFADGWRECRNQIDSETLGEKE